LKVLAAYWLWHRRKEGAVPGLVLLWSSAVFWYRFALPLGPLLGVAELVRLIFVWRTLDRGPPPFRRATVNRSRTADKEDE